MRHADIIILGFFAPPAVVAPYVIASRLALVLEAGQLVFVPAYTPRARMHVVNSTSDLAEREYEVSRQLGLLASGFVAVGLVVAGKPLLALFGADSGAFSALAVLCAGQLLFVGSGMHILHLSMSGHLRLAMTLQLSGFFLFVALLFLLVPSDGAFGAALAFLAANLFFAAAGLWFLWRRLDFFTLGPVSVATLLVLVCLLVFTAVKPELRHVTACLMAVTLATMVFSERSLIWSIVKQVRTRIRPSRK